MSTEVQRYDLKPSPPSLEEGYWAALLSEGEFAGSVPQDGDFEDEHLSPSENGASHHSYSTEGSDWEAIEQITQNDEVLELKVIGYNRGGLLVEWRSLRGFVPASQLVDFPTTSNNIVRRNALMSRVSQTLILRVIELNPEKNRLILSERAARAMPGERADILVRLQPGSVIRGSVTNLCEFGAFVDLGGLEGLAHISELSWGRVGHPSEMLQRGQEIDVYVLDVDRDAGRIALSMKRLKPDPWQTVHERYKIGETVVGIVTNVVDFGAFACIEEGLEGLIHVSELAEGHFLHPRNVVTEGQQVHAKILSIDGHARRLGLSLRLR